VGSVEVVTARACGRCECSMEGYHPSRVYCDACRVLRKREQSVVWNEENAARAKRARADYYLRTKDTERAKRRRRNAHLVRTFGITLEEYEALIASQGGLCPGCGDELTSSSHVDHCHARGQIRGVLCNNCNLTLGLAADSPQRLRRLALYLERSVIAA
jgi:hypothetical protein